MRSSVPQNRRILTQMGTLVGCARKLPTPLTGT
jgi:hypothetical protein